MARLRYPSLVLALLFAALTFVLVACGGGGDPAPSEPAAPSGISVSPTIGVAGETVTVTGSGLKDATVHLAGEALTLDSQAEEKLVFTVPSGVSGGPQMLAITNDAGSETTEFFVGIDFPSGSIADLAAQHLPAGTAVRLGKHTYNIASTTTLRNISLYGHSPAETRVVLPVLTPTPGSSEPPHLSLIVDPGTDMTLANLTLELGILMITNDIFGTIFTASHTPTTPTELLAQQTSQAVNAGGHLLFDHVDVVQGAGSITSIFSVGPEISPGGLFPTLGLSGVVELTHTNIEVATLWTIASDVIARKSAFTAGEIVLSAAGGRLQIEDSKVDNNALVNPPMLAQFPFGALLYGNRGFHVDETIMQADSPIVVAGAMEPGTFLVPPVSHIVKSTFSFISPAGDNASEGLQVLSFFGTVHVDQSEFRAEGDVSFASLSGRPQFTIENSTFVLGNDNFPAASQSPRLVIGATDGGGMGQQFVGNTVTFHNGGFFHVVMDAANSPVDSQVLVANNEFTGSGIGSAVQVAFNGTSAQQFELRVQDNTFKHFDQAVTIENEPGSNMEFTARFRDNHFDFDISALGDVATLTEVTGASATIDATHNIWGTNTSNTTVASYIDSNTGEPEVFNTNPITLP